MRLEHAVSSRSPRLTLRYIFLSQVLILLFGELGWSLSGPLLSFSGILMIISVLRTVDRRISVLLGYTKFLYSIFIMFASTIIKSHKISKVWNVCVFRVPCLSCCGCVKRVLASPQLMRLMCMSRLGQYSFEHVLHAEFWSERFAFAFNNFF